MKKRVSGRSVIITIWRISMINVINEKSRAPVITAFVFVLIFSSFLFVVGEKTTTFYVGGAIFTILLLIALSFHPQIYPHFGEFPSMLIVDNVYDEGSSVIFEHKGKSVRVNLTDVKSIRMHLKMKDVTIDVKDTRPLRFPTLIVSLRCKTEFGDEVAFIGDINRIKGGYSKDLQDLINRIEKQSLGVGLEG